MPTAAERRNQDAYLRKSRGVGLAEYEELDSAQGGRCAMCRSHDRGGARAYLSVDREPRTSVVRGLVCQTCEQVLDAYGGDAAKARVGAHALLGYLS